MEIDRENITSLSDEELFKTLKKCGLNVGPINKSTRSVYEKRLRNYLDGNSTISVADVTTTSQTTLKEPVVVLTAASLNETFPRARPEPKKEDPAPVQPVKKSNPEPPKQTILDDVNRIPATARPNEPTFRVLQADTNGFSPASSSGSSRMSYEPIAKGVERKSNELDFKLIRPATNAATTSTSSFVPTSTAATRRDVNYGLLGLF